MRHPRMTVAEHLAFAKEAQTFDAAARLLLGRFPKASRQTRALRKVRDALAGLRSVMDDEVCSLVPIDDPELIATRIYYGNPFRDQQ